MPKKWSYWRHRILCIRFGGLREDYWVELLNLNRICMSLTRAKLWCDCSNFIRTLIYRFLK
jgi:hypothetical protein